jgi:hypothetical protein
MEDGGWDGEILPGSFGLCFGPGLSSLGLGYGLRLLVTDPTAPLRRSWAFIRGVVVGC